MPDTLGQGGTRRREGVHEAGQHSSPRLLRLGGRLGVVLARPLEERGLARFVFHRLRGALLALVILFVAATAGYVGIEHLSILDAAFMTVITLSTVGYGEVQPLDGAGKLFSIGVIVASFVTLVYAAATLTNVYMAGEAAAHLRQSRGRRMRHELSDHVIVVGFGRVGQATARGVVELGKHCLVLESDRRLEAAITEAGCIAMIGDATVEADLAEAGIARAAALIAAAQDDATNLVVTLTARAMYPDLRVVSRVNEETWQDRIERAGADVARSPYRSYGMSLAASAITPSVVEVHLLPLLGLSSEEIHVSAGSSLVGRSLEELVEANQGVLLVGLRREQRFRSWHDFRGPIEPLDVLVALGAPENVRSLAEQA